MKSKNKNRVLIIEDEYMRFDEMKKIAYSLKRKLGIDWRKWKVTNIKGYIIFTFGEIKFNRGIPKQFKSELYINRLLEISKDYEKKYH